MRSRRGARCEGGRAETETAARQTRHRTGEGGKREGGQWSCFGGKGSGRWKSREVEQDETGVLIDDVEKQRLDEARASEGGFG